MLGSRICLVVTFALALDSTAARGQRQLPPVHLIDRPVATSPHTFGAVAHARQVARGRVLVNDVQQHRLVLLDSLLQPVGVVADSISSSPTAYGTSAGSLIRYAGDSSVFVLPRAPAMYVIDPQGAFVRVMAPPRPSDANWLGPSSSGTPAYDAQGRLVYHTAMPRAPRPAAAPGSPPQPVAFPDSAPLLRVDPATHRADTVGKYQILPIRGMQYPREGGMTYTVLENNPLPPADDWAVFADGSVAIVRGRDYHVDVVNPDGSTTHGPHMAFAWEPLSDDAKVALMDSVKRADSVSRSATAPPKSMTNSAPAGGGGGGGGGGASVPPLRPDERPAALFTSPQELPDYRPPFTSGAVRADADNHLWIRTTHQGPYGAGDVYDVVSRDGIVVDRVQLQPGRVIVGFGTGGVLLLAARDDRGTTLEKVVWTGGK